MSQLSRQLITKRDHQSTEKYKWGTYQTHFLVGYLSLDTRDDSAEWPSKGGGKDPSAAGSEPKALASASSV